MTEWYEDEVRALEARPSPPPRTATLFYGGSSIRLWADPQSDFPGRSIVNNGFGGATLADCVTVFDRLVRPVRPRAILLYAGDNDICQGAKGERVLASFLRFAALVAELPETPWAFVSIKSSPSRRHLAHEILHANLLVEKAIKAIPAATYIDIRSPMRDERTGPPFKYFTDDCLHMNRAGYAVWAERIAPWMERSPK